MVIREKEMMMREKQMEKRERDRQLETEGKKEGDRPVVNSTLISMQRSSL